MKHRMLEFLVMEMGFKAFAIEASYPGCQNINDYVLFGIGTKEKALASQGFWTWDTEEVLEMIEWIRNYNISVPLKDRVRFIGIDIQVLSKSKKEVEEYLSKVDEALLEKYKATIIADSLKRFGLNGNPTLISDIDRRYNELITEMILSQGRLISLSSQEAHKRGLEHLRVLVQAWRSKKSNLEQQYDPQMRDYYMGENFLYTYSQLPPDTKVVLWAHNSHVSADPNAMVNGGLKPLGSHLRSAFGEAYYSVCFAFSKGGFQAISFTEAGQFEGLKGFTTPPLKPGTIGGLLSRTDHSFSWINLRQEIPEEVKSYFQDEVEIFSIGSGFNPFIPEYAYRVIKDFTSNYDGIIFIKETTRARPSEAVKNRMKVISD